MVKPKRKMTRLEWKADVADAWREDYCAICGHDVGSPQVDDEGFVWQYCATCGVTRAVAHEYPPLSFYEEPSADYADPGDLPF